MRSKKEKVGLWMVGACGSVGSTVALGVIALRKQLCRTTGLVTELSMFGDLGFVDPAAIVIGGHEIRRESWLQAVTALHTQADLFDDGLLKKCAPSLRALQRNVRPGTLRGAGQTVANLADKGCYRRDRTDAGAVNRLSADIAEFRRRHRLDHVVVVNLASSEPAMRPARALSDDRTLQRLMARTDSPPLPPSCLYALAAVAADAAFVNFTPSTGIAPKVIQQRARAAGLPYMGRDGKTGESLVKSALAPMFGVRNLRLLSWVGQNILGNRDGAVLKDPRIRATKIRSKDAILSRLANAPAATRVSIDYVPSLGDWKTAWDFIHFEGFLNTRMTMQFTWQASDSVLAAPLIIDLVRLAALECRRGGTGPMKHLACFFKDPMGVRQQGLAAQWRRLTAHLGLPRDDLA